MWAVFALHWALVVVAALETGLAAPDLIGPWHAPSELAVWGVAASIGLLSAAARPRLAAAILPMLVVAGLLTVMLIARHVAAGSVSLTDEMPHLLLAAGMLLLVALGRLSARSTNATDAGRGTGQP